MTFKGLVLMPLWAAGLVRIAYDYHVVTTQHSRCPRPRLLWSRHIIDMPYGLSTDVRLWCYTIAVVCRQCSSLSGDIDADFSHWRCGSPDRVPLVDYGL